MGVGGSTGRPPDPPATGCPARLPGDRHARRPAGRRPVREVIGGTGRLDCAAPRPRAGARAPRMAWPPEARPGRPAPSGSGPRWRRRACGLRRGRCSARRRARRPARRLCQRDRARRQGFSSGRWSARRSARRVTTGCVGRLAAGPPAPRRSVGAPPGAGVSAAGSGGAALQGRVCWTAGLCPRDGPPYGGLRCTDGPGAGASAGAVCGGSGNSVDAGPVGWARPSTRPAGASGRRSGPGARGTAGPDGWQSVAGNESRWQADSASCVVRCSAGSDRQPLRGAAEEPAGSEATPRSVGLCASRAPRPPHGGSPPLAARVELRDAADVLAGARRAPGRGSPRATSGSGRRRTRPPRRAGRPRTSRFPQAPTGEVDRERVAAVRAGDAARVCPSWLTRR